MIYLEDKNTEDIIFISITIFLYFVILMYLGYQGFKATKTFSDYALGSRKLGPVVGAMNVGASDMSSWLLMGVPGIFYLYGLSQSWMVLGLIVGSYLSWKIVAQRLRQYTEIAGNSLTIPSFLENRFEDKSKILNGITALTIVFFFTIYIASGFVGSAKLFAELFGISYLPALIISCVAIIFYAVLGGFLAVSWADLFQGILMLVVLVITPAFAIYKSDLLAMDFIDKIQQISPQHLDFFHNVSFFNVLGFLAWGLGYFGQPHIISKYMAIKEIKEIPLARRICISWMTISMISAGIVGIVGFACFSDAPLDEPETVFVKVALGIFHPLIIGVLISAMLAAIMSTLNSQIIICCSSLSEDFYRRLFRKNAGDREMLIVTRLLVVLIALIALLIASNENSSVLSLVARAWAGLGASIGPIILFSLFWKKTTKSAAIVGVISGTVGAIAFSKFEFFSYEILPAFLLSSLLIFVVSLFTQKQIPSSVEDEFRKIKEI